MDENAIVEILLFNVSKSLDEIYKQNKNEEYLKSILEISDLREYFEEYTDEQILNKKIPKHEVYNLIEAWLKDLVIDYETIELFEEHDIFWTPYSIMF